MLHSNEIHIPKFNGLSTQELVEYVHENIVRNSQVSETNFDPCVFESQNDLQKFNPAVLNDLVRDRNLKKKRKKKVSGI